MARWLLGGKLVGRKISWWRGDRLPGQARKGDSAVIVLGRCKTPVFGLQSCILGTFGSRNFLKEVRTLLGVTKNLNQGSHFMSTIV